MFSSKKWMSDIFRVLPINIQKHTLSILINLFLIDVISARDLYNAIPLIHSLEILGNIIFLLVIHLRFYHVFFTLFFSFPTNTKCVLMWKLCNAISLTAVATRQLATPHLISNVSLSKHLKSFYINVFLGENGREQERNKK